jgi:peptide/nickel transport system substrate-binding protein
LRSSLEKPNHVTRTGTGPRGVVPRFDRLPADHEPPIVNRDYRTVTDIRVRRAIGYAFPYRALNSASGNVDGITFAPGRALLPPGTPGRIAYNPLDIDPGETDPARARALLAEAGHPPGEYTLSYPVWTHPLKRRENRAPAQGLEAGGFGVEPDPIRSYAILTNRTEDPSAPYNLRSGFVCADWPTGGSSALALLSTANSSSRRGLSTHSFFHEPSVDAEIARIEQLPVAEQPAAWAALDQEVAEKYYPLVVEGYAPAAMLHGSRIGGMNNDAAFGMPTWKNMYVKP